MGITQCIAIGTTTHGKWSYRTVVVYNKGTRKDGTEVWLKGEILCEATTASKIQRLAEEAAATRGIPLLPHVRHYTPCS